jgi:hypothetical protein
VHILFHISMNGQLTLDALRLNLNLNYASLFQSSIKKVKNDRLGKVEKVFVSYVGGTLDEEEWINVNSKRLRPPTTFFKDTSMAC